MLNRFPTLRRTMLISVAALAAIGLANCAKKSRSAEEATTIHIGNIAEPLSLDPHQASGSWENRIIGDMFIGLTTDDPEAEPIPGMAESWTTSADGLVWTFKLRDANWSDGVPVTADDFVYAWQRILTLTPPAKYASMLYIVKNAQAIYDGKADKATLGVRAVDAKTLEVTLEHPAPYLPGLLSHYTTYPVPKHVVEKYGNDWIKPEHIVVNGPFKLVQWRVNDLVEIEKNPNFYDAQNVCLTRVYFYPTPDDAAAERAVRSGRLDIQTNFSGSRLEELRKVLPDYPRVHADLSLTYFVFNMRKPEYRDPRVREALSLAIDREFTTSSILQGGQIPAYSLAPEGILAYPALEQSLSFKGMTRDQRLARARTLLAQAGYGPNKPLAFRVVYRNSGDNPKVMPVMQQNWRDIAPWVQPELQANEVQLAYQRLRDGDFDVGDASWVADFNDARNFLFLFETKTGIQNYGQYSNPEFDRLLAQSDATPDGAARAQLMARAEQILLDTNGVLPVYFRTNRNLVHPRITGWVDNAVDIHRERFLCTTEAQRQRAPTSP